MKFWFVPAEHRTPLAVLHVTTCRCVSKASRLRAVGEHVTASTTHNKSCFLGLSVRQRHPCFSGGCGKKQPHWQGVHFLLLTQIFGSCCHSRPLPPCHTFFDQGRTCLSSSSPALSVLLRLHPTLNYDHHQRTKVGFMLFLSRGLQSGALKGEPGAVVTQIKPDRQNKCWLVSANRRGWIPTFQIYALTTLWNHLVRVRRV